MVLKVLKPSKPLKGKSSTHQNLLDTENEALPELVEQADMPVLEPVNDVPMFEHGCVDMPDVPENDVASEILSEYPVTLPDVMNSGEPSLDIHDQIKG